MTFQKESGSVPQRGKLLVIAGGPTCSGKTQLAIELATEFKSEIISADSRQFYAEMNIGTAKPSPFELQQVKHHFIGSTSVTHHLNASAYSQQVMPLLNQLFSVHEVVIMAGGSGLYIDAVIFGIDDLPPANEKIREKLHRLQAESGIEGLRELLRTEDPVSFNQIDTRNPRRLIRALEVTLETGTPYSTLLGKKQTAFPYKWIMTSLNLDRQKLYERINQRTAAMIRSGLKEEAISLLPYRHLKALQTVGYREMFDHLDGKTTLAEAESKIAQNTRNYAKRQMTWFKKYAGMICIEPGETQKLINVINQETGKS